MDKYKKLKAVQGLIVGLSEEIYRCEQFKTISIIIETDLINQYFDSIKELINMEDKTE